MSHDYHEGLPGFDPERIWQDGCAECEHRGEMRLSAQLAHLDPQSFRRAMARAHKWPENTGAAEALLLHDLRAVQVRMGELGVTHA